jgi:hypothetical protein
MDLIWGWGLVSGLKLRFYKGLGYRDEIEIEIGCIAWRLD